MMIFFLLLISATCVFCSEIRNASVSYDLKKRQFLLHDTIQQDSVAHGFFQDEISVTGWSYLEVYSNESYPDSLQAYAAGLVEGYLTKRVLNMHWDNMVSGYCEADKAFCHRLHDFMQKNQNFIKDNVKGKRNSDVYWHQVGLTLEQLSGLLDGSRDNPQKPSLDVQFEFLMLSLFGDLLDLERALHRNEQRGQQFGGSCSAIVKVLQNNSDVYFSHNSWSWYKSMLRILKKYDLRFHTTSAAGSPVVPGYTSTFSSYPGVLVSIDDFYLLSSGLAVMETTIDNFNDTLWKYVNPVGTIMYWQRGLISNRLAKTGEQWASLFAIMNSGTYNNQWMVIDYNKFQPGEPLQDGLFTVLEQLPGYVQTADMTNTLREEQYWGSYNVAYFSDVFNLSAAPSQVAQYGDMFSHDNCPRALIFKRDQLKVVDIPSLVKLMRYNDYKNDPLSRCNCTPPYTTDFSIAHRGDLDLADGTYPLPKMGHVAGGAIDMKATSYELFKKLQFVAAGGPTFDQVPPFQWSKTDFDKTVSHKGHPDLWNFEPIVHKWR